MLLEEVLMHTQLGGGDNFRAVDDVAVKNTDYNENINGSKKGMFLVIFVLITV